MRSRGLAGASVSINANDSPGATVRAGSMLRGHAVALPNGARTTNMDAVGA